MAWNAYVPPNLQNNDPVYAASAANVKAWLSTVASWVDTYYARDDELAAQAAVNNAVTRFAFQANKTVGIDAGFGIMYDHFSTSPHQLTIPTLATLAAGPGEPIEGTWFDVFSGTNTGTLTVAGASPGMLLSPLDANPVDAVVVGPKYGTAGFRLRVGGTNAWHVMGAHTIP